MTAAELIEMLWAQAWQLSALVAAVAILTRLFARNRPHLAHMLWLVVLVKCLTPPVWTSPVGLFCWLQSGLATTSGPRFARALPDTVDVAVHVGQSEAASDAAPERMPYSGKPAGSSVRTPWSLPAILAMIWFVGLLFFVTVAFARWVVCVYRLQWTAVAIEPDRRSAFAELARRLGVRRARLSITSSRVGPAVLGLWRPTIVLPQVIAEGRSDDELAPILAHELIHARRGDLWVGLAQIVAQAAWWFHPLVWLAARAIGREAERSCDEEVIAELGLSPARYARSLLDVLELKKTLVAVPVFPGMRPIEITSQRMERIMSLGQGCRRRTPWWCWAAGAVMSIVVLPGAAILVAEEPSAAPGTSMVAPQVADSHAALVRDYDVTPVLEALQRERGLEGEEARSQLLDDLHNRITAERLRRRQRSFEMPQPRPAHSSLIAQKTENDWIDKGGPLRLRASSVEHDEIRAAFDALIKYGFSQIELDIRFSRAPRDVVEKFSDRWQVLELGDEERDDEFIGPNRNAPPVSRASYTVEQVLPTLFDGLDESRRQAIFGELDQNKSASVTSAPRLILFNGQTASVADITQRPFVAGPPRPAVGNQPAQPPIRIVETGMKLFVRAELTDNDSVLLDYKLVFSNIREVKEGRVAGHDVKQPVVVKLMIESSSLIADGGTLMLNVPTPDEIDGKPRAVALFIRANRHSDSIQTRGVGVNSDAGFSGRLIQDEAAPPDNERAALPAQASEAAPYAVVYAVKDLVVPRPNIVYVPPRPNADPKLAEHDYDGLVELLTSTVYPASWEEQGGPCTCKSMKDKGSLVITQSDDGHEQIAALLAQLRSAQRVRVELDVRYQPSDKVMRYYIAYKSGLTGVYNPPVTSEKAGASQRFSMYNGQTALVDLKRKGGFVEQLRLTAIVASDRRSVIFFNLGNSPPSRVNIADGEPFLVNLAKDDATPRYVIATPRIVVIDQPEEPRD